MRTVQEHDMDYIFKQMFYLKQPHELTEKERKRFSKGMGIAPEILTKEGFTQAANKMGLGYHELFFMARPRLSIFQPIVLSDYYVAQGINGFIDRFSTADHAALKRKLEVVMGEGDFEPVFRRIDKRGRHMAYFKLFHRIPDNQKFDIFYHNLDSPGHKDIFNKEEINEILSYRHYSERWNEAIQNLTRDYGESEYFEVYQPEFGIYKGIAHEFYWSLNKDDAVKASHEMKTNGRIKERLVHISKILHYDNADRSIQALPEHSKKLQQKVPV
jgi:hypothetical protein